MKRDGFGDDGPAQKRNKNEEEVAFLIPSKVAGSIIGKGGANISRLRSTYKASISIPDCPGPERVLAMLAEDVESILEITKEILPNLSEGGPKNATPNDNLDIRMLIHQSRAGCVIGKGGTKIKELREKTGCRLKVFSNPAPQSTERIVQLLGKPDQIVEGVREVLELTRNVPVKGPVMNYDPHNYDDFYSDEYGGFGAGGGGSGGGGGGGGMRGGPRGDRGPPARGMGPPPMGPGRGPMPPPRGGPPPMGRNGPPGPGPRFNDFGPGPGPRGNFNGPPRDNFSNYGGNFGPGNRGPGGPGGNFNDGGMQESSTQVTIPKDLAGAIIGKAGSRIRSIRADSGAGIEIAEPLPGSTDRIITITGTQHQIQTAQYLLQQSVHEAHPNLGGGRGNF